MDVTVVPEEGNFPAIAKALLEVADHPGQVRMITYPAAGFLVPEDVFKRFEAANPSDAETASSPQQEMPPAAPPAAQPKRRGRPRKVQPPVEEE